MAINFPSNPNNGDTILVGNTTYTFDSTSGVWDAGSSGSAFDGAFSSLTGIPTTLVSTVADMAALIAKTGMTDGDQVFVQANNNLYIYSGTGWYKIATVQNDSPTAITGVSGSYSLAIDGTPTVITAVSTDPEGFPLTWSYSTSGLGSIATVSQTDNVFTITPSTDVANVGTFSLTINATDGVNGAVSANTSIELEFTIANSNYTTLLATAVDTSDNNNITDSSTNNYTITAGGSPTAGTFSPYRHGGYSLGFGGGTGDYLQLSANAGFSFGTGDFTIEAWVYYPQFSNINGKTLFDARPTQTNGSYWIFSCGPDNIMTFKTMTSGGTLVSDTVARNNQWVHYAAVREGTSLKLFANGTLVDQATDSSNISSSGLRVGGNAYQATANPDVLAWNGYIADARIVKGTAVYTSAFTPSTERLTSITNTTLLIGHLPYVEDGSSSSQSITVNGSVVPKPFGPYDYAEYLESDNGGSVYFDGTGDYWQVSSPPTLGANDWTIETWWYPTAGGTVRFMDQGGGANSHVSSLAYSFSYGGYTLQTFTGSNVVLFQPTIALNNNQWYHVTLTFDNTTKTYTLYHNGISLGTTGSVGSSVWNTGNIAGQPLAANIYKYNNTVGNAVYFSDWRLSDSVVYTSDFTPPTAPQSSNGSLLHVKGTDASIIDKSQSSNLNLFGNTTGSTTQVKFADTKSMYFDGTGDYITTTIDGGLGSGDFTIDGWVYFTSFYDWICLVSSTRGSTGMNFGTDATGDFNFYDQVGTSAIKIQASNQFSVNTWYHFAVVRSSGVIKAYIDGTQVGGDYLQSANYSATSFAIAETLGAPGETLTGYMQDVRITKGLARYTANFTPPTVPLKG